MKTLIYECRGAFIGTWERAGDSKKGIYIWPNIMKDKVYSDGRYGPGSPLRTKKRLP